MLTKEDLLNIKSLLDEQSQCLEQRLDKLEERMGRLDERMEKLEERLDKLEERLDKLEERMDKLEERLDRLEERLDKLEERVEKLEKRMDSLEEELAGFQRYTVQQLTVLENTMSIKFSALFDMHGMFVKEEKYKERNAEIDNQLNYIEPLRETVQSHSQQIQRHEEILKELVAG